MLLIHPTMETIQTYNAKYSCIGEKKVRSYSAGLLTLEPRYKLISDYSDTIRSQVRMWHVILCAELA